MLGLALLDFRKHPVAKPVAEAIQRSLDTVDIAKVCAYSEDQGPALFWFGPIWAARPRNYKRAVLGDWQETGAIHLRRSERC